VVVALAALVTSLTVAGLVYGVIPTPDRDAARQPSATSSAPPSAPAGSSPSGHLIIADPLASAGVWEARDDKENRTTCAFDGALVVTRQSVGSYRCPGVLDALADFSVTVDVKLRTPGTCAAIWFRFDSAGFVLRICADGFYLATHGVGGPATVTSLRTFQLADPITRDTATKVGITAKGRNLTFSRDGQPVGEWNDARFQRGRVVLGIFQDSQTNTPPPFSVSFANIEIRTLAT
jgi:hypothetical protein